METEKTTGIEVFNKRTPGHINIPDSLYKFLLFLGVFDGVRSWMVAGNYLSVLKEITICLLALVLVLKSGVRLSTKRFLISNFPFIIYLAIFGTVIIWINDVGNVRDLSIYRPDQPNRFIVHIKTIEAFFIIYLLLNYESATGKNMRSLMNYFVLLCVGMILFTLLVYFVIDLSAIFEAHWYGRISIGYPPADAQVLSFALAYLLFIKDQFKSWIKTALVAILIFGIVMNATGTGLLSLVSIFLVLVLFSLWTGGVFRVLRWSNLFFIFIVFILISLVAITFKNGGKQLDQFSVVFETKINSVKSRILDVFGIGNGGVTDDSSVDTRSNQIANAFAIKDDAISKIIGGPISIGILIENQNFFLLRSYGYLGLLSYYAWILFLLILSFKKIRYEKGRLFLVSLILIFLSNLSLVTTYMFGVATSFALLISFVSQRSRDNLD